MRGPGHGDDFCSWSSLFLNSSNFSNFSRPGLKDLTLGGVRCLGGVLGGNLCFGGDDFWAYVGVELLPLDFFEGGELSVPTWDDFWERGSSGWSFLPPFPTVSHSAFASSELTVGDEGGVGFFYPLMWARLREPPFLCLF